MANYYSLFDPMVANGITPMPIDSMVFGNMPLMTSSSYLGNPYYGLRRDTFTKSNQKDMPPWKYCLFLAIGTILSIAAICKLKKLPESMSRGWSGLKSGIANKWNSFIGWFKK